jgi:hypothetical protein
MSPRIRNISDAILILFPAIVGCFAYVAYSSCFVNELDIIDFPEEILLETMRTQKTMDVKKDSYADSKITSDETNDVMSSSMYLRNENRAKSTRELPNFEQGGIIIFFHMPKTGGTSFRMAASRNKEQLEFYMNDKMTISELKEEVLPWTLSKDTVGEGKKVKLVELHWDLDSLVSMQDDLDIWRQNAKENNIPFFVLTVVRDPVETYFSFYNFFCVKMHKLRTVDCHPPWNEDHLLQVSPDNPQARWLCHATTLALSEKHEKKSLVDLNTIPLPDPLEHDPYCSNVLTIAEKQFDWVGLKHKSETTLQLFSAMGIHMEHIKSNANKLDENLKFSDFSEDKKEIIRSNLKIDQELYDWADSTFTLEKFGISN